MYESCDQYDPTVRRRDRLEEIEEWIRYTTQVNQTPRTKREFEGLSNVRYLLARVREAEGKLDDITQTHLTRGSEDPVQ